MAANLMATPTLRRRMSDWVKPDGLSYEEWLFRLESDRRAVSVQIRREVHTRGFAHGAYCEKLDRAIIFARAAIAKAEGRS